MYSFTVSVFKLARKCTFQRAVFCSLTNGSTFNFESSQKSFLKSSNVLEKNNLLDRKIQSEYTIIARKSSKASTPAIENFMCQVESIFKDVKMKDMAQAPTPSFWSSVASLAPIALPSLSFILTGFHPSLFTFQMTYSALLLAFHGGVKFGNELEQKDDVLWENIPWAAVPFGIGILSLILPDVLSPLTLSAGFLLSAFVDLTLGCFPAWYKSIRLAFVIPAVLSLFIAFLWNLFN